MSLATSSITPLHTSTSVLHARSMTGGSVVIGSRSAVKNLDEVSSKRDSG